MLCKVAQPWDSLQPLDYSCPCNCIVCVLHIKSDTDEGGILFKHHPDSVTQDSCSSWHQCNLARFKVFPKCPLVGLDNSPMENSDQGSFDSHWPDLGWNLLHSFEKRDAAYRAPHLVDPGRQFAIKVGKGKLLQLSLLPLLPMLSGTSEVLMAQSPEPR